MTDAASRRLVVISNRVPPPPDPNTPPPAGGLVAAVLPALEQAGGLWFGWSGREGTAQSTPVRRTEHNVEYATIDLSPEEIRGFYEGFSNSVLWPLLHGFLDRADIEPGYHDTWLEVNRRYAREVAELCEDGDVIWVHDYHLLPLGSELRRLGWEGALGYFHHIPVNEEGWRLVPGAEAIAESLAAYNLVGVQTERDAATLRRLAPGARIEAHPIGIDPERVRASAARHPGDPFEEYRRGRQVLLGADRLDYSKGIGQRVEAFERLLTRSADARVGAVLVQWAAPSRTGIAEYAAERAAIERLVDHANESHDGEPVRFELTTLPLETVAAGLRDAEVCLVTSFSDGMNLVAKEYVALQRPERPGVLILSDGCGAAERMREALIVPAGDVEVLEAAMEQALAMPLEERRQRWAALSSGVEANTVHEWRRRYLEALASAAAERTSG